MYLKKTVESNRSRQGVALILVLGFLSILLVMAVSFVTMTRTERMVSNASMEAQRGRQLVRTALSAAISDFTAYPYGEALLMHTNRLFVSKRNGSPLLGGEDGNKTLLDSGIHPVKGEVRDWIPRVFLTNTAPNYYLSAISNAEWIIVREDPGNRQSKILGRYAYICFDMSGGIDGNLIARADNVAGQGDFTNRHSVQYIGMTNLPETVKASEFKRLRGGWHGFESLSELIRLTDGIPICDDNSTDKKPGDQEWRWAPVRTERYGPGLNSNKVSSLVPYSLTAYRGYYDTSDGINKPYENPNTITSNRWVELCANTLKSVSNSAYGTMYQTMQDYITNGYDRVGTRYPSSKNIPMINELQYTLSVKEESLTSTSSRYDITVDVGVELWYPFRSPLNNSPGTFSVSLGALAGSTERQEPDKSSLLLIPMSTNSETWTLVAAGSPPAVSYTPKQGEPDKLENSQLRYRFTLEENGSPSATPGLSFAALLYLDDSTPAAKVSLGTSGQVVDEAIVGYSYAFRGVNTQGTPTEPVNFEVRDPRLNHLPYPQWTYRDGGSFGSMNESALADENFKKEGSLMFCRNGPMETPGELGYISTGEPWKTIDLCSYEGSQFLNWFMTDENVVQTVANGGVFYTNGTINPNTMDTNVLQQAFADLQYSEVPRYGGTNLTAAQRDVLVRAMDVFTKPKTRSPRKNEYETGLVGLGDWGYVMAGKEASKVNLGLTDMNFPLNNNQKEQLIRNTWGLFSPNSGLFTVLVIAQAIKESDDELGLGKYDHELDIITGERRAVALVWYDPFSELSNKELRNEYYIRIFRYMDD